MFVRTSSMPLLQIFCKNISSSKVIIIKSTKDPDNNFLFFNGLIIEGLCVRYWLSRALEPGEPQCGFCGKNTSLRIRLCIGAGSRVLSATVNSPLEQAMGNGVWGAHVGLRNARRQSVLTVEGCQKWPPVAVEGWWHVRRVSKAHSLPLLNRSHVNCMVLGTLPINGFLWFEGCEARSSLLLNRSFKNCANSCMEQPWNEHSQN